jgi:predicted lysophospholipase L1 biosynthesis ABC-type transport system permease subunit
MNFIFNLTRREIRSSWRRLLFFFLCIAIGVGSVVALRSLVQNLSQAVGTDARALLTADLEISSTNDFSPTDIQKIEEVINQSNIVEARNEAMTTSAMARPLDAANENLKMVELKGIEPPFPLVGNFKIAGGAAFDFRLLENNGAVVSPLLLDDLQLKVGDKIKIADGEFEIRATFDEEPGGASGFRLGPRVFIEKKAFDTAGITTGGGRIRRRILYRTSDNPTELVKQLRESLKGTILSVQSYRETQENLGEQFTRTENYLSLTGLLILVLGGVGVWNVARVFVEQKRKSVAVLKCLGAPATKIITVYLLQILTLGFAGSLFGVFLAQCFLWFAKSQFNDALPAAMSYAINPSVGAGRLARRFDFAAFFRTAAFASSQYQTAFITARCGRRKIAARLDENHFRRGFGHRFARACGLASRFVARRRVFSRRSRFNFAVFVSCCRFADRNFAKIPQFRFVFHRAGDQFAVSSGQSNPNYSARRRLGRVRRACRSIFADESRPRIRFYA